MSLHFKRPISELTLSGRTFSTLVRMGIKTIGDVVQKTEHEFLRTPNFGRKSMNDLRESLRECDLKFGMDVNHVDEKITLFNSLSKSIANKCEDSLRVSMAKMLEAEGYVDKYDAIQEHKKILSSYEVAIHNSTEG
jgi:DNA-directed RNA polymerase alpha subunit